MRRSLLYVPGSSERKIAKSALSAADVVILDLEDAVTVDLKEDARQTVLGALRNLDFGRTERAVRINPIDSGLCERDIEVTIQGRPDIYQVPKVSTAEDVRRVADLVTASELTNGIPEGSVELCVIGTETPRGVLNLDGICGASPRVTMVQWGQFDLSAATGARRTTDERGVLLDTFRMARALTVFAAAANGIVAIDTVFEDFRDREGLTREAREAYLMGFAGKALIHPDQIDIVNEVFSPSAEDIEEAEAMIAAFSENESRGLGAFTFKGQMVDAPQLKQARQVVELARAIGAGSRDR